MSTFCKGIPGGQGPHRVTDPNELLVEGICWDCKQLLTGARGWGSSVPNLGKNTGKGTGIVINPSKHREPKPRVKNGGRSTGKTTANTTRWRNYPTKRKQPWGMERD